MDEQKKIQKKSLSAGGILRLVCAVAAISGGMFLGSSALIGDGALTLLHLYAVRRKEDRVSSVLCRIMGTVGILLLLSGFSELSMTISYARSAVGMGVLPLMTALLLLRVAAVFAEGENPDIKRELAVTVGVTVSVLLSWLVDFYFEPAFAASLGVWMVCLGFAGLFTRKKTSSVTGEDSVL